MAVSTQTPNELMVVFSNTISNGFSALQGPVDGVFGTLIALVVALTGIQWALSANRDVLAAGFGKILLIGFFAYLINDWQVLSQTIWAGFIELGLKAGGGSLSRADFLNPGKILQQGWEIVKALGETPAPAGDPLDIMRNLTDALVLGLAMIGIMLAFAVLSLQIIVTLLEFKIVTLAGFVLLPFGIWSKSAFLAERPLGFVVSSGLKVLALAIVVSGARSIFDQLQPSAAPDLYEALAILAAALLLAMLALFIPNLAAALVTGGPALGAGAAVAGGLAVGGAAVAAVTAAAGMAGLGAGAARIAGPARAAAGSSSNRLASPPGGSASRSPPPPPSPPTPQPPPSSSGGPHGGGSGLTDRGPSSADAGAAPPSATAGEAETTTNDPPIAGEIERARRDVHRALGGGPAASATASSAARRSAALQAFFAANAGRGLLPGNETSGAIAPHLKDEEA